MNIQTIPSGDAVFAAIKSRQQSAWGSGDYAIVGTTLQIVGETLCEAVDLRAGQKVLDVAAGNGNATLAAARRFADVTSTDYVGTLLTRGAARMTRNAPKASRHSFATSIWPSTSSMAASFTTPPAP